MRQISNVFFEIFFNPSKGIRETVSKRSLDSNIHDKRYGLCLTQKRKCITTNAKEGHQKLVIFQRYRINCESCMTLLCLKAFLTHGTFIFRGGRVFFVGNGKGLRIKSRNEKYPNTIFNFSTNQILFESHLRKRMIIHDEERIICKKL